MKRKYLYLPILAFIFLFNGCCLGYISYDYYGNITGTVMKIDDGTADYGIVGDFSPESILKRNFSGKFRFEIGSVYNHPKYEEQIITIENCYIMELKDGEWETYITEYINS